MENPKLQNCPGCNAEPGQVHRNLCDVQRHSANGRQVLAVLYDQIECDDNDPQFSRWTGIWPGEAECLYLGYLTEDGHPDLNRFYAEGLHEIFFIKPPIRQFKCITCEQACSEQDRKPLLKRMPPRQEPEYVCPHPRCKGKLEEQ